MTLKHAQHKNSNRKCRSTFYSCKLLQQLLSFNKKKKKKKKREIRESRGKKCRMHYFCEKGAEMLDKEPPSYPDDGIWKGGLNTS